MNPEWDHIQKLVGIRDAFKDHPDMRAIYGVAMRELRKINTEIENENRNPA
jgi:hypothetical protein